eukprot:TRINITY_DN71070_c0_g1_i1.p1 TRINITY_DN71070_c0_g1~~TRINITY_DN71070_c0_g1_i1.p1  ORF type:complete len:676 (+),score=202.14 TRINITY_DN71070_c0_g1_i1:113-2029(+)
MAEKEQLYFRLDGKKYAYTGFRDRQQRDFFEMLVKLRKKRPMENDELAECWRANFPGDSKTTAELVELFSKEKARQDERARKKAAATGEEDPATSARGPSPPSTVVHRDPSADRDAAQADAGAESGRVSPGRRRPPAARTEAEQREIQDFIDQILNEDTPTDQPISAGVPPVMPTPRVPGQGHTPTVTPRPAGQPSPPPGDRVVKFKLEYDSPDVLKVVALKLQPEGGTYDELVKIVEAKCDGNKYLSFVDSDGDTIEIEDDESLAMFVAELEERAQQERKLVMKCSKARTPAPAAAPTLHHSDAPEEPAPAPAPPAAAPAAPTAPASGSRAPQFEFKGHTQAVYCCAADGTASYAVTGGRDGTLMMWSIQHREKVREFPCLNQEQKPVYVLGCDISRDGKLVAASCADKTVRVFCAATGKKKHLLKGHGDRIYSVAFTPDCRAIASGSSDKTVKIWDAVDGTKKFTMRGHTSAVFVVGWSTDGKWLCSAGGDNKLVLWHTEAAKETERLRHTFVGHKDCIWTACFSPDSRWLLSASMAKELILWSIRDRSVIWCVKDAHHDAIHRACFVNSAKMIVSCSRDKTLKLWKAESGEPIASVEAHKEPVYGLSASLDAVVSCSLDSSVHLWSVKQLESLAR